MSLFSHDIGRSVSPQSIRFLHKTLYTNNRQLLNTDVVRNLAHLDIIATPWDKDDGRKTA